MSTMFGMEQSPPVSPHDSLADARDYLAHPDNRSRFDAFADFYNSVRSNGNVNTVGLSHESQEIVALCHSEPTQPRHQPTYWLKTFNIITGQMLEYSAEKSHPYPVDIQAGDRYFGDVFVNKIAYQAHSPVNATVTLSNQRIEWRSGSTRDRTVPLVDVHNLDVHVLYMIQKNLGSAAVINADFSDNETPPPINGDVAA